MENKRQFLNNFDDEKKEKVKESEKKKERNA